jgi:AraC family transcriptional regulator
MYPVEIKKLRSRYLVGMAHFGAYDTISTTYATMFETLSARGLVENTRQMVAVYYDDPDVTPVDKLRAFAGVTAPKTIPCEAPLAGISLPTARYAVLRFTGDYAGLHAAYAYLYGPWLAASGETPSGEPVFEVYHNSPQDTAAQDLITEICMPLA